MIVIRFRSRSFPKLPPRFRLILCLKRLEHLNQTSKCNASELIEKDDQLNAGLLSGKKVTRKHPPNTSLSYHAKRLQVLCAACAAVEPIAQVAIRNIFQLLRTRRSQSRTVIYGHDLL